MLAKKQKGEIYDGMTDYEGNELKKPLLDIAGYKMARQMMLKLIVGKPRTSHFVSLIVGLAIVFPFVSVNPIFKI